MKNWKERIILKVKWLRGIDTVSYTKPHVWFCLGIRGSGKSTFLESVAEGYLREGNSVMDLFGSRDGEALGWLRSPWAKDKKILLLKGENVDVKAPFPVKVADALTLSDFEKNDIIISASPLYLNIDQEFEDAAKIEDVLYRRLHYKKLIYLCCREASNFYYSRLKVSESQLYAKAQMIYLLRESRHMGISMGLDSIRSYAIDIDIRSLSDFTVLKSQGVQGLSREMQWLYKYINPKLLRNMSEERFVIITKTGAIGYGTFPEIEWHKKEREDILAQTDVQVEYGEVLQEALLRGTYKTVGDREHAEIIELYVKGDLGTVKIAERLKRSSRTIGLHIDDHNRALRSLGNCPRCKRANSAYAQQIAERPQKLKHNYLPQPQQLKQNLP